MGILSRLWGAVVARAAAVARDVAGLAGAGLLIYGVWLIYQPAAYITAGAMIIAAVFMLARKDQN